MLTRIKSWHNGAMKTVCEGETVHLEGSPLPYCRYEQNGIVHYRFDSSGCECPVPMIAALVGLRQVTKPGVRLVMINHCEPMGLLGRVGKSYKIRVHERKDGLFEIIFDHKKTAAQADLYGDLTCPG